MADSKMLCQRQQSGPKVLPPTDKKLLTASIDFGTTYTGYSYAFYHEPLRIFCNTWEYKQYTEKSCKAPSTVLLDKDGNFDSFGFEAENKYDTLTLDEEHHGWYLFQKFKMKLYSAETLSLETKILDIEGKEKPALLIFTMVIKDLKNRLLKVIRHSKGANFNEDQVFWILTVPAIWSDSAKHFMHLAANKAGITSDQLRLVLEPEAASFYCQTKGTIAQGSGADVKFDRFRVGYRYIILDLGGGTADIATHEVLANDDLMEIDTATGGALGSCQIDQEFFNFMETVFGPRVIEAFKEEDRSGYRELLASFEEKKRSVQLEGDARMVMKLPAPFIKIVELQAEPYTSISDLINSKPELKDRIKVKLDKLILSSEVVKGFFKGTVGNIVKKITHILRTNKVDAVLVVGGFSESPYVQQSIKKAIEKKEVDFLAPEDPGNHVMYGATLTNIFPNKIAERISRYSYGFKVQEPYDKEVHKNHKNVRDSGIYCPVVYYECITIGQRLKYNETVEFDKIGGRRDTDERKRETTPVEFWCSDRENTKLCLPEQGCKQIGTILLIPPDEGWPDEVNFNIQLRIGEAEFCITVTDKHSGKDFKANVNFLRE